MNNMTDLEVFRRAINAAVDRLVPSAESDNPTPSSMFLALICDAVVQVNALAKRLHLPELLRFEQDEAGKKYVCVVLPWTATNFFSGENLPDWVAQSEDSDDIELSESPSYTRIPITDPMDKYGICEIISLLHVWTFYCDDGTSPKEHVHQPVEDWTVANISLHLDIGENEVRKRCRNKKWPCGRAYKPTGCKGWRIPKSDFNPSDL